MEPAGCCHPLNIKSTSYFRVKAPVTSEDSQIRTTFQCFLPQLDSSRVFPHLEMGLDSLGTKLSPKFDPYRFVYRNGLIYGL